MVALLLSLASLQAADPWRAVEPRLTPEYRRCFDGGDAARGVHPAMMECLDDEHGRQDERLNAAYAATLRRLSRPAQARLRTLQRGWIRARDRRCQEAWDEAGGGQASDLAYRSCQLRETVLRRLWLDRYR